MISGKISNGSLIDKLCPVEGEIVDNKGLYTCILNQTDIKTNKNKFYIMQLIQTATDVVYFVRYGRVGENGKVILKNLDLSMAIASFEKQFKTKTGNDWKNRHAFVNKKGKYFLAEISYEDVLSKFDQPQSSIPVSTLDIKVQELIRLISDTKMMNETLIKMDIDPKKLPLGKIKQSQLDKAGDILNKIENTDDESELIEYSSEYYTLIPHAVGRNKPPVINTSELLNKYRSVLEDLKNLVISVEIIESANKKLDLNPLDTVYLNINTQITYVNSTELIYDYINNYLKNTHGGTHKFSLKLKDIYAVERFGNRQIFEKKKKELGNVELLIHGSRLSNWTSILKLNLLLDPSKLGVPIAGKMFGYGVYFANSFSKSAQYCGLNYGDTGIVCFALAEVALGQEYKKTDADTYLSKKILEAQGFNSCYGQGTMTPSDYVMFENVKIPQGKLIKSNVDTILNYDEKIVYDTDQFMIKYLVLAEFSM